MISYDSVSCNNWAWLCCNSQSPFLLPLIPSLSPAFTGSVLGFGVDLSKTQFSLAGGQGSVNLARDSRAGWGPDLHSSSHPNHPRLPLLIFRTTFFHFCPQITGDIELFDGCSRPPRFITRGSTFLCCKFSTTVSKILFCSCTYCSMPCVQHCLLACLSLPALYDLCSF